MSKYNFDAVIFDLDGVITKTAQVHSIAWKKMFDEVLMERERRYNELFREFSHTDDYLPYVDGKPRYKGVESFLKSRGIDLPYGDPGDSPDMETICGVGNRKNIAFNEILKSEGVEVFESTAKLIRELKAKGIRVGVASSSKNCKPVLEAAGLLALMETRVDGVVSAEIGLKGKPEADIFTTACDNLEVGYSRAVIVEDAVSGVQAGRNGNFGLVIGIARENNEKDLLHNGADIVVQDLEELSFNDINNWFTQGLLDDSWSITYRDYDPGKERSRESLLAIGNGYFGTRGAMEEMAANKTNYPGTYIAGVYNRLVSKVGDRDIENEDFVNCPNWLPITFRIDDGEWLDMNKAKIIDITRKLDFRNGLLSRTMIIEHEDGKKTQVESKRFASMSDPHLAAMKYSITPVNYSGNITVKASLDGDLINDGVERYRQLNQQHIESLDQGKEEGVQFLKVRTVCSGIEIAEAFITRIFQGVDPINPETTYEYEQGKVSVLYKYAGEEQETVSVEKMVGVYTSRDVDVEDLKSKAVGLAGSRTSFDAALQESEESWARIWDEIDIRLEGDRKAQKLLRLHLFHLMVTASYHNENIDAGIPARGLHGEAYRGHIFWDELFILPLYDMHFKNTAKSLLMYRYNRLNEALKYAEEYGYEGAMYPWQSGSDGREETQIVHLNPLTGIWGADHSSLQRHVSLAIAYNIWQYYNITNDLEFAENYGAEMFMEICRFWASKAILNEDTGRYEIKNVMGPDEFHEKYKDADVGGLKDNAYTNIMVVWMLQKVFLLLERLGHEAKSELVGKVGLKDHELKKWEEMGRKMNLDISEEGIIAQFDGYFNLKELDWDYYRRNFGNIYRMDRILKSEDKSADDYKVAKQADTLMTFYNLDKDEVDTILNNLGYKLPADYLQKNLEYYLERTSHGSTLSRVVHAQLAGLICDYRLSWDLYEEALESDYTDIQGGTTGEGIHTGVMAGTVLIALFSYAGVNLKGEILTIDPQLPAHWKKISFGFHFKNVKYQCEISEKEVRVMPSSDVVEKPGAEIFGRSVKLECNNWNIIIN